MSEINETQLDNLLDEVLSSSKYQFITRSLVERLVRQEIVKRRKPKETIKAVKNKLHQVAGAYLASPPDYTDLINRLQTAQQQGEEEFLHACQQTMALHASTRERLPDLEDFYTVTLSGLPTIHNILDVACGLNPLAIPWMELGQDVDYYAVDIYENMMAFLQSFFEMTGVRGHALAADVIEFPFTQEVDVAFILKTIPCLEQIDKSAGERLLDSINARWLVVSFPIYSLGGRSKGMLETYERHFEQLITGKGWQVERFEFPTELAFRVTK